MIGCTLHMMSDGDTVIVMSIPRVNLWRRLLLGLFFLSGISGLIYEVAWTRMLHLLFGDTVLAVSTVLASFMAGLGLGSFSRRRPSGSRSTVLPRFTPPGTPTRVCAFSLSAALEPVEPRSVWA